MKRLIKKIMAGVVSIALYTAPASGQPASELPSEGAWKEIAPNSILPSERTDPFNKDLRGERPTDETPIGGMSAPVPEISLLSLLAFTLAAAGLIRRKRKEAV
jgi:hypothetical protein